MIDYLRNLSFLKTICCAALLLLFSSAAAAQSVDKIPRDVIEHTATHGSVLVLVGLALPWQLEARLSENQLRAQRATIASIQNDLLDKLTGRKFTVVRRYHEIPGIALEVSAEALAELARLPIVTNVLLDRPAGAAVPAPNRHGAPQDAATHLVSSEKVPPALFTRAAREGTVLVLAGLRTPWQREDGLTEELWALQRSAIHSTQSYVLAELAGTRYKVMRLYGEIPGIALRVGVDALIVLEKSPAITNVVLDRPAQVKR